MQKKITMIGLLTLFSLVLIACNGDSTYEVTFYDHDGTELKTESVEALEDATPPDNPHKEGVQFSGWDESYTAVESDITVTALYDGVEEIIERIKGSDYYYETYDAYIDDDLYQTSTLKILEDALYLNVFNVGEHEQEVYITEREENTYYEEVVHPQAGCSIESNIDRLAYINIRRNLPNHRYLHNNLEESWFEREGVTYTLKEAHYSELEPLFGGSLDQYTLKVHEDSVEMNVTFVEEDTKYNQVIVFKDNDTLEIDLDGLYACDYKVYDDFEYIETQDGIIINKYIGSDSVVEIPETIDDSAVKQIGFFAFAGLDNISKIILPDSLETIGPWAFSGMDALEKIYIPSSTHQIDEYAFRSSSEVTLHIASDAPHENWHEDYKEEATETIFNYTFDADDFLE